MKPLINFLLLAFTYAVYADELNFKQFEEYAQSAQKEWEVPGMAIGIVKDGHVVYSKGFGVTELDGTAKVDDQTLFQIGSLSKSFTSALVSQFIDEKQFKWDDRVVDHDPNFMMYDPWVTREFQIEDTLAQRSGLQEHCLDMLSFYGFSREEMMHVLRFVEPKTSFRSSYAYQNIFFVIAAEVMRLKSGKNWEALVKERLFEPLGMRQSSLDSETFTAATNSAWLHVRDARGQLKKLQKPYPYIDWVYTYGPAGGINSTVQDMCKYAILQVQNGLYEGKQLVSKENMERMHRPHIFVRPNSFYGLGWVFQQASPYPIIWHTGGTSGHASVLAFIPEENIGIVVLSNVMNTNLPIALALQFFDLYHGKSEKNWSQTLLQAQRETEKKPEQLVDARPSLPLHLYTGYYTNPIFGKIQILVEGEDLVIINPPKGVRTYLKHRDRDTFTFFWPGVEEDGTAIFSFSLDAKGLPSHLSSSDMINLGLGSFTRID